MRVVRNYLWSNGLGVVYRLIRVRARDRRKMGFVRFFFSAFKKRRTPFQRFAPAQSPPDPPLTFPLTSLRGNDRRLLLGAG